jgi:L-lactate utilization protein LutC
MTDRATFISTLRRALTVPVPPPRHPFMDVSGGLPPVEYAPGPSGVEAFTENLTLLGGAVERTQMKSAAEVVRKLVNGRAPVLLGAEPIVAELKLEGIQWPDCGIKAASESAISVVGVRAAIARTGSVVVDARLGHGRAVSLLPPACVFVFRESQLVETPGDVLRNRERYWPEGPPSQVVLVTGPSRSADIEMTLTRGVHGPGEVHAVIVEG